MRIYFAAALFTQMEREWNRKLAAELTRAMPDLDIVLPQDFDASGKHDHAPSHGKLFRMCVEGIDAADAVLAIVDGVEVDSGTSWEMGYAYARNKPVVGVRTDFRPGAEDGVNIMLSRSCRFFVTEFAVGEDTEALAKSIVRRLKKVRNEIEKVKQT